MRSDIVRDSFADPSGRNAWLWAGLALALAIGGFFVVGDGLIGLSRRWEQPEYSHGYLIPLVSIFILWQRRAHWRLPSAGGSWAGPILFAVGVILALGGTVAMSDLVQAIGFILMLAGLALAALGRAAMRYVWAPLAFLAFALPMPAPAYLSLSLQLQLLSSELGAAILQFLGISVFLDGNVIDLGTYKLQVAEACSGLRYLFPLASFGALCAWLYRAPVWARVVLFLSVVPITVVLNSARIALTGVFIEFGSVQLAEGFLHLFEGWLIFVVALALMFGEMWLLARISGRRGGLADCFDFDRLAGGRRVEAAAPGLRTRPPGAPVLACLALTLAAVPLHAAASDRVEIIPERPGLVTFPLQLGAWRGDPIRVDRPTLDVLKANGYLLADFHAPHAAAPVNFWVVYYESQVREHLIHSPQECLPGSGWEFVRIDEVPAPGADFALNRALIANGSERMLMYYWYEQRGRQLTVESWMRVYVLLDAFTTRRSDGALVRLMTPVLPGESVEAAEGRLSELFRASYPHLEVHVGA